MNHILNVGALQHPHLGIWPRGFIGAYTDEGSNSLWAPFAPNRYGAVVGDATAALAANLNAAGTLNAPGGAWGAQNRDQRAQNAAVAICRMVGATISHEIAHTLGLTRHDGQFALYEGAHGVPVARSNGVHIGCDNPGRNHNGTRAPAAAGALLTRAQRAGTGAAIPRVDDLSLPALGQNLMQDSGRFKRLAERVEANATGVVIDPAAAIGGNPGILPAEPANTFLGRNQLQLRAVLPKD